MAPPPALQPLPEPQPLPLALPTNRVRLLLRANFISNPTPIRPPSSPLYTRCSFRDFEWLHKQLQTDVPGAILAVLPPKDSTTYISQKATRLESGAGARRAPRIPAAQTQTQSQTQTQTC